MDSKFEFKLAAAQWQGLQISMANFDSLAPSLRGDPGPPRVAQADVNFSQRSRRPQLAASVEAHQSWTPTPAKAKWRNCRAISLSLENNFDIKGTMTLQPTDHAI